MHRLVIRGVGVKLEQIFCIVQGRCNSEILSPNLISVSPRAECLDSSSSKKVFSVAYIS